MNMSCNERLRQPLWSVSMCRTPAHRTSESALAARMVSTAGVAGAVERTLTVTGSIGLLAPAGTPVAIIEQIAQATRNAVAEPTYQKMLIEAGMESTLDPNPEKLRRVLSADIALWTPVVKTLGLKID